MCVCVCAQLALPWCSHACVGVDMHVYEREKERERESACVRVRACAGTVVKYEKH